MAFAYHPPGITDRLEPVVQGDWFDQFAQPALSTETIPGRDPVTGAIGPTTPQQSPYGTNQTYTPPQGSQAPMSSGPITMQQFSQAWMESPYPGTVEGLKQFLASNPAYAQAGITLGGSKGDKVYGPGGAYWGDAVISAGLGGRGKSALSGDTGSQAGGQMGTLGSIASGAFLKPFEGRFSLPTSQEFMQSPGVQSTLNWIQKAGERSAAARGTLLTPGTQQRINQEGADYIGRQYGDFAGMKLGEFGTNRDIEYRNQDAPFGKLSTIAQLGRPGG